MDQLKSIIYIIFCLNICDNEAICPSECRCHDNTVQCQGPNITTIPVNIPRYTKLLIIHDTMITALENTPFNNLSSLTELRLAGNKISEIEIGTFDGLLNLTSLDLQNNNLTLSNDVYCRGVFRNLTKVETLLLHANSEVYGESLTYPDEIGRSFPNLKFLTMDGLCNKTFPLAYSQLLMLNNLSLSGHYGRCELLSLFNSTFEAFRNINLENLDITNCSINYVEPHALASLRSLAILNISFQKFSSENVVLQALQGLRNNTNIRYIIMNSVLVLGSYTISKEILNPMASTYLTHFYFNDNFVTWIENDWHKGIPKTIQTISALGNYIISHNNILAYIIILINLKSFSLSPVRFDNSVTYPIPIPLSLESFEISGVMTATPLRGVHISSINNSMKSFTWLDSVIPELFGSITGLRKLETIIMSNINCKHVSRGFFSDFPMLKKFDMSRNFLGDFIARDVNCYFLQDFRELEILDLSNNVIRDLPSCMLKNLNNIKYIYLHNNSLINFNAAIGNAKYLSFLNLAANQISSLNRTLIDELTPLFDRNNLTIDLSDNYIQCSCDGLGFLKWIQEHRSHFVSIDKYKCYYSDGLKTKNLSTIDHIVDSFDRVCDSMSTLLGVTVFMFISYICVIISAVVYKKRMHLFYWYHAIKRTSSRVVVPISESEFKFDAFVSFSESENAFIKNSLLKICENENGLKLCVHFRDFIPGTFISENIVNAIHASRKTIIILSNTYLTSDWCMYEFNMARMENIYSGRETLIIIKYENLNSQNLSLDILESMKSQTYGVMPSDLDERGTFWNLLITAVRES